MTEDAFDNYPLAKYALSVRENIDKLGLSPADVNDSLDRQSYVLDAGAHDAKMRQLLEETKRHRNSRHYDSDVVADASRVSCVHAAWSVILCDTVSRRVLELMESARNRKADSKESFKIAAIAFAVCTLAALIIGSGSALVAGHVEGGKTLSSAVTTEGGQWLKDLKQDEIIERSDKDNDATNLIPYSDDSVTVSDNVTFADAAKKNVMSAKMTGFAVGGAVSFVAALAVFYVVATRRRLDTLANRARFACSTVGKELGINLGDLHALSVWGRDDYALRALNSLDVLDGKDGVEACSVGRLEVNDALFSSPLKREAEQLQNFIALNDSR